jgi:hypothetical protein
MILINCHFNHCWCHESCGTYSYMTLLLLTGKVVGKFLSCLQQMTHLMRTICGKMTWNPWWGFHCEYEDYDLTLIDTERNDLHYLYLLSKMYQAVICHLDLDNWVHLDGVRQNSRCTRSSSSILTMKNRVRWPQLFHNVVMGKIGKRLSGAQTTTFGNL